MSYLVIGEGGGFDPAAWIALILSVTTLGWMIWSEFTSYRRRQADEYWYRGIFSPSCVEPLIEFLDQYIAGLQSIDVGTAGEKETREFCEQFAKKKENVIAKLWVSQLFSSSYYELACTRLDEIEDETATRLGGWVVKPASASGRDLEVLRDAAIARVASILAAAADINLNKFAREQRRTAKGAR